MQETIPKEFRNFPDFRLSSERRLCAMFDPVSIAAFPVAERDEMGIWVLDNFCEEHIM